MYFENEDDYVRMAQLITDVFRSHRVQPGDMLRVLAVVIDAVGRLHPEIPENAM